MNGGRLPMWGAVLQMAESWGTPPWEIMDAPGSAWWAARYSVYQDELGKAKAAAARRGKR